MYCLVFGLMCITILINIVTAPSPGISTEQPKSIQTPNVCTSKICTNESINLQNHMDQTIDPCENFNDFVCGKYLRETILREDKPADISFFRLWYKLQDQIRDALLEGSQPNQSPTFKLAEDFLRTCMDYATLNASGIAPMLEYLDKYGGWPVIKRSEWNGGDWDWLNVKRKIFNDGFLDELILAFKLQPDERNSSKQGIFIDRPEFGLSQQFLLKGSENKNVQYYYNFMVDLAVLFGANRKTAEDDMKEVLEFEMKLANISLTDEERRNSSLTSNYFNITTLQNTFPLLNWRDFINWNLKSSTPVNDDDVITVPDVKYLHELNNLLKTAPKKTVANYIGARLVIFSSDLLNGTLHARFDQYNNEANGVKPDERSTECIKKTSKYLPMATAAIYVHKYFNKNSKNAALAMAMDIKSEFIEMLKRASWMDSSTREKAIEKANVMALNIAFPDELINNSKLDEYYRGLQLEANSLLHNVLNTRKFLKDKEIHDFRMPIVKSDWREIGPRATEVNAFNYPSKNAVVITAAILQDNFFEATRPSYMNYASIGWFIGHEVTHGFDDQGRERNAIGNLVDWWDAKTSDEFKLRAKCFVDKYSHYKHPNASLNLTINGVNTQGENIADVGGLKAAYGAYQKFVQKNGAEPTLPNLNYTPNQLFWISGAVNFCAKTRIEFDTDLYTNDVHSPFNYRINGVVSSLPQFANDFNCPSDSPMNPTKKCEVW